MVDNDDNNNNDKEAEDDVDNKNEVDGVVVIDSKLDDETSVRWERINSMKRKRRCDVSSLYVILCFIQSTDTGTLFIFYCDTMM